MKYDYSGEEFLNRIFKDLALSKEVVRTSKKSDKKAESIKRYMDRLERVHKLSNKHDKKDYIKRLYFDKYVIKKENIPYGVDSSEVIRNQQISLERWIDYLTDETTIYPMWVKYWVFQGMLKLGTYDIGHEVYQRRSEKTIAKFIDCNPEIIAKCANDMVNFVQKKEVSNEELKSILKTGSFKKIYEYYEKQSKEIKRVKSDSNNGIWIKYNEGSREDAVKLANSLNNKNTGWCTASENMAINQVCGSNGYGGGDFYVYYTMDDNGEYTMPRIAIRMNGNETIGEIRGIEAHQNLEHELIPILQSKLKSFSFLSNYEKNEYTEKIVKLEELVEIYKKTISGKPLTKNELKGLYCNTYGFGWQNDPLVDKTIAKRNIYEDYNMFTKMEDKIVFLREHISRMPNNFEIDDKEIILEVVKHNSVIFFFLSKRLRNDKDFIKLLISNNKACFSYLSESEKKDKEFILEHFKSYDFYYESYDYENFLPEEFKQDKEFLLQAIRVNRKSIKVFDKKFLSDKDVLFEIIINGGDIFDDIPEEILKDRNFIIEALKNPQDRNYSLSNLLNLYEDDIEIVLLIVRKDMYALEYASDKLKDNKEVVLAAMSESNNVLKFVSDRLKDDKEVVLRSVNLNPSTLEYASDRLKNDREVVLTAITKSQGVLKYASDELKDNKKIVKYALKCGKRDYFESALEFASDRLKDDDEIVDLAIRREINNYEFISERKKKDKYVALSILKVYTHYFEKIDQELREDRNFLLDAITINYRLFEKIPEKYSNDRQFVLDAIKANPHCYSFLSSQFKEDKEIVIEALKRDSSVFFKLSDKLKKDKDVISIFARTAILPNVDLRKFLYETLPPKAANKVDTAVKSAVNKFKPIIKPVKREHVVTYVEPKEDIMEEEMHL